LTDLFVTYPAGHHGEIDLRVYLADDQEDAEQFIEHSSHLFEKPLVIKSLDELREVQTVVENIPVITPMITSCIIKGRRAD